MTDNNIDVVKWYTRARKFPQLIGKTPDGAKLWGGPYTFTQAGVGFTVLVVGLKTIGLWGGFGLIMNVLLLLGVSYGLAMMVGRLPVGSRNPLNVAAGLLRAMTSPSAGRYRGAPVRPSRPHRIATRLIVVDPTPTPPGEPGTPDAASWPPADPVPVPPSPQQPRPATRPSAAVACPQLSSVQRLLATSTSTSQEN